MRVVIVGGGVIGLGIAWQSAARGMRVAVVDSSTPQAASRVAAGLLIPAGGRISGHHLSLRRASAEMYASTVSELEELTGVDCGYNPCGSLTVAYEPGAHDSVEGLANCLHGLGVEVEKLSGEECREREPALAPEVAAGFYSADHQVDPEKLMEALAAACRKLQVSIFTGRVASFTPNLVRLSSGEELEADRVVVSAGAWTSELTSLPVYPVKGEVIHLRGPVGLLNHNLILRGQDLYVANRGDGRLVVGATEVEAGFDTAVTATLELKSKAERLVPALAECEVLETRVGFRPRVGDGLPLLGPYRGVVVAGAHYRNGILLMPITARLIVEHLESGGIPEMMERFLPGRDTRHRLEKSAL